MLYKIDWNKYLVGDRYRPSTILPKPIEVRTDFRNAFESDFGRVIFCSAIRRMHDKTQVFPLTNGDSVHTRLTHSMEVLGIAYSLGINYCRNPKVQELYGDDIKDIAEAIPVILKTAAFIHDVGNPPFGHFGETIIQEFFKTFFKEKGLIVEEDEKLDFECFDGNAQGYRIITKLQYLNDLAGLNLTYATLGAYTKYPNPGKINKEYIGTKKHGIYYSEREVFNSMVEKCSLRREDGRIKRHPLSFLVEAADSICYLVLDIEDGYSRKLYKFQEILDYINSYLDDNLPEDKIEPYKENDKFSIEKLIDFHKSGIDRKDMVNFRISLISYFVTLAGNNFLKHLKEIDEGEYNEELIEEDPYKIAMALKNFAIEKIYAQEEILKDELTGNSVLTGLLDYLTSYVLHTDKNYRNRSNCLFSKNIKRLLIHETNHKKDLIYTIEDKEIETLDFALVPVYYKLRSIVDLVSGMTDKYALRLYQQLSGQRLS